MAEIMQCCDLMQPGEPWKSTGNHLSSGLEAPRNSFDLPFYVDILMVRHKPSKERIFQNKGTSDKVIHNEVPSQPNIIARLMGIDTIPTPAVIIRAEETSNLKPPNVREAKANSRRSAPFKISKCSLLSYRITNGASKHCHRNATSGRALPHKHHPQEELLQKIKEDFQAWQTSKVVDSARNVAAMGNSRPWNGRYIQILAQENLHKEKMEKYGYANKNVTQEGDSKIAKDAKEKCQERVIKVLSVSHCDTSEKCRNLELGKGEHNCGAYERTCSSTRIVILKPSFDNGVDGKEPLFGSSKVKRDCNMEEFLEEVKDRLKKELQGKARSAARTSRGTDPKKIALDIAKQIRETVTRDLGKRLSRTESFRAFRSDCKHNATSRQARQENVRIDTKKILMDRLKSALRTETVSPEKPEEAWRDSSRIRSKGRARSLTDISLSGIGFEEQNCTSGCLTRPKTDDMVCVDTDVVPPRTLVRSFSAPASRACQDRIFLEDNVGNRKYAALEIASEDSAMPSRSSSFSLRETVSNLRHSFSLGGKLFGRNTHWSKKKSLGEFHPKVDIGATPSPPKAFSLFTVAQDDFTELPPSPVSPLAVEEHSSRHFFSDLSCTLPELSLRNWSEFDAPISEISYKTDKTVETEINRNKAYIREVLVIAGLYDDGSLNNKANAWVDSMARSISDSVFEEVEAAYYCQDKKLLENGDDDTSQYNNAEETAIDHRMLFDLANEAFQIMARSLMTGSSLRQWVIDSSGVPRGRNLVDDVWHQVQILRNPPLQEMQTIDSMMGREVQKSAWIEALYEDVYVIGRKIERAIFDELIGDIEQEIFA